MTETEKEQLSPIEYKEKVVAEVRSSLKDDVFSDEQISQMFDRVTKTVQQGEIIMLSNIQKDLCDRCAACCRFCTDIAVSTDELIKISKRLDLSVAKTMKKFQISSSTRKGVKYPGQYYIAGKPCPFLKDGNICSIYDIRPFVCRAYPAGGMTYELTERVEGRGSNINFDTYCHIIQKFDALRITNKLMDDAMPPEVKQAMEQLMSHFHEHPIIKQLEKQRESETDPQKKLFLDFQIGRILNQLVDEMMRSRNKAH